MTNLQHINELTPSQALQQAVKASELLLQALNTEAELDLTDPKIAKLQLLRDQLLHQTFSEEWTEAQVQQHLTDFQSLETLDKELQTISKSLRTNLHQLRTDNQNSRKAVSAYGHAKGQFHR